jgi:hypothetical protein
MLSVDLRKIYLFSPVEPTPDPASLPSGSDLYYECLECTVVLNSVPFIKCGCTCGNLKGGAGKTTVTKPDRVRVVKGKLK